MYFRITCLCPIGTLITVRFVFTLCIFFLLHDFLINHVFRLYFCIYNTKYIYKYILSLNVYVCVACKAVVYKLSEIMFFKLRPFYMLTFMFSNYPRFIQFSYVYYPKISTSVQFEYSLLHIFSPSWNFFLTDLKYKGRIDLNSFSILYCFRYHLFCMYRAVVINHLIAISEPLRAPQTEHICAQCFVFQLIFLFFRYPRISYNKGRL